MVEEEGIRVQLARIEGKQDLTNERLDTTNKINDERHAAIKVHLVTIDNRLIGHADRIVGLEGRELGRDGERKGVATSTKVAMGLLTLLGGGIGAAFARLVQ